MTVRMRTVVLVGGPADGKTFDVSFSTGPISRAYWRLDGPYLYDRSDGDKVFCVYSGDGSPAKDAPVPAGWANHSKVYETGRP